MELFLHRDPTVDGCTFGCLFVDGVFECHTLEDEIRDHKLAHETCIGPGRFEVVITKSARFGRMLPILLNVPEYTGVRVHPGNYIGDTDGCILVGTGREAHALLQSRMAMDKLQPKLAAALAVGDRVFLTIENPA